MSQTDAMTTLLKQNKTDISTVKANKILVGLGLLVEKERPSSKYAGKIKKYKALSTEGLKYGLNKENPQSPGQTTPSYYHKTFGELLLLIQNTL